jgi:four helix bundle protein
MLNIYHIVLGVLKQLQPALRRIEVRDRDLGRQLRRCSSSVALNLAEGRYSRGKNRGARYHNALGSAREKLACLEGAVVCSYVQDDASLHDQLDRIVATLVKLVAREPTP